MRQGKEKHSVATIKKIRKSTLCGEHNKGGNMKTNEPTVKDVMLFQGWT